MNDNISPLTSLVQQLKHAMQIQGVSSSQLARLSGVSVATLSRILNGQSDPSFSTLYSIFKALGLEAGLGLERPRSPSDAPALVADESTVKAFYVLENTHLTNAEAAHLFSNAFAQAWSSPATDVFLADSGNKPEVRHTRYLGPRQMGVEVAYPHTLIETGSVVSLLSVISTPLLYTGAKVQDVFIPPLLLRGFMGPGLGAGLIRDMADKIGRPLLSATLRPVTGLSARLFSRLAGDLLANGLDMTCDPTTLHHLPHHHWRERLQFAAAAESFGREQTNETKAHLVNISAPGVEEMLERAKYAAEQGLKMLAVDPAAVGWAALHSLAKFARQHDMALCAVGGRVLSQGSLSQPLVAKLLRLAGCDVISLGSPLRGTADGRKVTMAITRALREDDLPRVEEAQVYYHQSLAGHKGCLPLCGGGHTPWHMPALVDTFENDVIIQCGGSSLSHPWGPAAGAKANRVAIEAAVKAKNQGRNLVTEGRQILLEAAQHNGELSQALQHWREGSSLFGVIQSQAPQGAKIEVSTPEGADHV